MCPCLWGVTPWPPLEFWLHRLAVPGILERLPGNSAAQNLSLVLSWITVKSTNVFFSGSLNFLEPNRGGHWFRKGFSRKEYVWETSRKTGFYHHRNGNGTALWTSLQSPGSQPQTPWMIVFLTFHYVLHPLVVCTSDVDSVDREYSNVVYSSSNFTKAYTQGIS